MVGALTHSKSLNILRPCFCDAVGLQILRMVVQCQKTNEHATPALIPGVNASWCATN